MEITFYEGRKPDPQPYVKLLKAIRWNKNYSRLEADERAAAKARATDQAARLAQGESSAKGNQG